MEIAGLVEPEGGGHLRHAGPAEHAGGKALGRKIDRADLGQHLARAGAGNTQEGARVRDIDREEMLTLERRLDPGKPLAHLGVGAEKQEFVGRHPEGGGALPHQRLTLGRHIEAGGGFDRRLDPRAGQIAAQGDHAREALIGDGGEALIVGPVEGGHGVRHSVSPRPCRRKPDRRPWP